VTFISVAATQRKQQQQQLPTTSSTKVPGGHQHHTVHSHVRDAAGDGDAKAAGSQCGSGSSSRIGAKHSAVTVAPPPAAAAAEDGRGCGLPSAAPELVASLTHNHGCARAPACHISAVKQQVVCFTMEAGCVAHSVTLGVALGVLTDARLVLTLMAVLAVHQAVEGLALGAVLAATALSQRKRVVLAVLYAATLPAGIAIGLGVASTYDAESLAAKATQGVANGVSGGMLLYVSLISMLSAEFSSHELLHRPKLAGGVFGALVVGIAAMCVLGVWA
jgi:zinc transporter 1/2/3